MVIMKKNFMKFAAGRLVFAIVLICTMVPTVAIAQGNVDELLKQAEQAAKKADKKPADGKLQLAAARSFVRIELGEKKDIDRALVYANRALKIAESQTVMQDTLKGFSYLLLGGLFFEKRDFNKSFECYENGLEALGKELGRYDCFTIYEKLYFGQFIMLNVDIRRGSLIIQQAFLEADWKYGVLTVGAKQQPMELKNNELSSGSQTLGINASPVPQVRLGLNRYWAIPYTKVFGNGHQHL